MLQQNIVRGIEVDMELRRQELACKMRLYLRRLSLAPDEVMCGHCNRIVPRKAQNHKWCSRNCATKAWNQHNPGKLAVHRAHTKHRLRALSIRYRAEGVGWAVEAAARGHEDPSIPDWKRKLKELTSGAITERI